jgi:hypothetical protein
VDAGAITTGRTTRRAGAPKEIGEAAKYGVVDSGPSATGELGSGGSGVQRLRRGLRRRGVARFNSLGGPSSFRGAVGFQGGGMGRRRHWRDQSPVIEEGRNEITNTKS